MEAMRALISSVLSIICISNVFVCVCVLIHSAEEGIQNYKVFLFSYGMCKTIMHFDDLLIFVINDHNYSAASGENVCACIR